jgi:prepilin-type N-terminal cleavage/methylation domain-containing protein
MRMPARNCAERCRSQRGLTLIELIVAVALFGIVLLGIVPLFLGSVKSNYSANEYTSVNTIARDRLEQLMNRPFQDAQLAPGVYVNDLPAFLPDPTNPTALSAVKSPFRISYQVTQWQVPDAGGSPLIIAVNAPFSPTRVVNGANPFQYKRIDVTVISSTDTLGIGSRLARVSGLLNNPTPVNTAADCLNAGAICSVADGCALGAAAPCP